MLNDKLKQELIDYAKLKYPQEMCGLIVEDNNEKKFIPCCNISTTPNETFEIAPTQIIHFYIKYKNIAIVHSHTNGRNCLSIDDIMCQMQMECDWYLVSGENVYEYRFIPPLLGRKFVFNKQDCYNLFQDVYMLAGINFPSFEYVENWYELEQNLYVNNLEKHGFEKVHTPEIGDVILFCNGSKLPNHAGVYVGSQMFLHHAINQLSKRDMLNGYWLKTKHSYWRYKWKSQLNFTVILDVLGMNSR